MRYLLLPWHFLKFWYLEGLTTFVTTWKNLILYLEEDLAVGLMWKLLFVPLFHDASLVGRFISVIFRLIRIALGIFAFILVTVVLLALATFWVVVPFLTLFGAFDVWGYLGLLMGLGLFIIHFASHPHKKVWQVKNGNFWEASRVDKKITIQKLRIHPEVVNLINNLEVKIENLPPIQISEATPKLAFDLAKVSRSPYIGPRHFFVAALKLTPGIENSLLTLNLKTDDFVSALNFLEKKNNRWRLITIWDNDFTVHHLRGINRGWLGVPTPTLDSVSTDLTRQAAKGAYSNFYGRSRLVSEMVHVLSQEGRKNLLLVGPAGAGKTATVEFMAAQILKGDAPPGLATKRIVALDNTRLISGVTSQGDMAERIKIIFEEVADANIILCLEEIHDLGEAFPLMMPYLDSDKYQFIATTEQENYIKTLEKESNFARLFTKIEVPPTTPAETLEIIEERAIDIERKNKIFISYLSLKKTVELAQLMHERVLPDSALVLLDEVASIVEKGGSINTKTIEELASKRSNIPVGEVLEKTKQELLNLEDLIHQNLIDQTEAVKVISDTLRRSAAGLREKNRPIGSFLFVGPTGVGKTELAKTLARVFFKSEDIFIRFDMSEYQSAASVDRLIGESGQLTEAVRNKPYALLLFDEFEKADPKILTLFLQILEDGRLTDATGNTVDFTNTIIIATSNVGSLTIARGLQSGQTLESLDKAVNDEVFQTFKPELINRFDDVVLFKTLSKEDLQKIVTFKLEGLKTQMRDKGYLIEFDETLIAELTKRGFDPVLGARPLRRLIQDSLEANLSKMILENKLEKGKTFKIGVELLG